MQQHRTPVAYRNKNSPHTNSPHTKDANFQHGEEIQIDVVKNYKLKQRINSRIISD